MKISGETEDKDGTMSTRADRPAKKKKCFRSFNNWLNKCAK